MSAADVLILLLLIARAYLRLLFIRLLKLLLRAFLSVHFFLEAHWLWWTISEWCRPGFPGREQCAGANDSLVCHVQYK